MVQEVAQSEGSERSSSQYASSSISSHLTHKSTPRPSVSESPKKNRGRPLGSKNKIDAEKHFRCEEPGCSHSYQTKQGLLYHKRHRHAQEAPPKNFKCPACGRGFETKYRLRIHLNRHDNQSIKSPTRNSTSRSSSSSGGTDSVGSDSSITSSSKSVESATPLSLVMSNDQAQALLNQNLMLMLMLQQNQKQFQPAPMQQQYQQQLMQQQFMQQQMPQLHASPFMNSSQPNGLQQQMVSSGMLNGARQLHPSMFTNNSKISMQPSMDPSKKNSS